MANPANNAALVRANAAANNNQGGNAVGSAKQACPLYDVIIIVAGTVDPVNSELEKLANSYETPNSSIPRPPSYDKAAHDPRHPDESQKDSNYYWSENPKFVGKLASLVVLDAGNPIEAVRLRPERLAVIAKGRLVATRQRQDTLLSLSGRPASVNRRHKPVH